MAENINLSPENEDELFRFLRDDERASSEKIVAPRYSYWRSVFRVFFRKRLLVSEILLSIVLVQAPWVTRFSMVFLLRQEHLFHLRSCVRQST